VPSPGVAEAADTHVLGEFLRDVTELNQEQRNFRIFGPDETLSNRLNAYPWLIHRLTYRRTNHDNIHVRGDSAIKPHPLLPA
jgi:phosphoketolase